MQVIKIYNWREIPQNYTGIAEWDDTGSKEWYLNGERHREDGPAYEYSDGSKEWWLNGKCHRVDGPAYEHSKGTKEWWLNGKLHREDGPAVEYPNGSKSWWLNGELIFKLLPEDQPFLILEETEEEVKILTVTETKWAPIVPGLKELENKTCKR